VFYKGSVVARCRGYIVNCSIRRSVGIKQLQEFLKSGNWLRRYCILSAGVFYFEPPCNSVAPGRPAGLTVVCSDAKTQSNFRHRRDVETLRGVDDVQRHARYLGHVTLPVAYRDAADAHVDGRYRLDLVDVVALDQTVHETAAPYNPCRYTTYDETFFG